MKAQPTFNAVKEHIQKILKRENAGAFSKGHPFFMYSTWKDTAEHKKSPGCETKAILQVRGGSPLTSV